MIKTPIKSQKNAPKTYPKTPPRIEKNVVKRHKKSQEYLLAKIIGIRKISGGIGKKIASIKLIKPKKFSDFLLFDILIVL